MKKQDNEQQKANELLQQLQAVYLNDDNRSDDAPEREEQPPVSEVGETSAPVQTAAESVGEAKPTEIEPKTPEETEPKPVEKAPQKKYAAPAAILTLTEETPETANNADDEKDSVVADMPAKKEPAKTAKPEALRGSSQGTTLPKTASNPFLIKPKTKSEPSAEAVASEKSVETPTADAKESPAPDVRPKVRPNATKVPPRKRSGLQTGAIRPKNSPVPEADAAKKPSAVKHRPIV